MVVKSPSCPLLKLSLVKLDKRPLSIGFFLLKELAVCLWLVSSCVPRSFFILQYQRVQKNLAASDMTNKPQQRL